MTSYKGIKKFQQMILSPHTSASIQALKFAHHPTFVAKQKQHLVHVQKDSRN